MTSALRDIIETAPKMGAFSFDGPARALWIRVYPALSEGHQRLFGAVTGRAEAQVTRLALLYAVLDGDHEIGEVHLRAALEMWRYAEDSARHIFGDALGDNVADRILSALRATPDGMTRTEISELFGRNVPAGRLDAALRMPEDQGLARMAQEHTEVDAPNDGSGAARRRRQG